MKCEEEGWGLGGGKVDQRAELPEVVARPGGCFQGEKKLEECPFMAI